MKTKVCTTCGKRKLIKYFYRNKNHPSGYNSQCKKCMSKYFINHKKEKRNYDKIYRIKNILKLKEKRNNYYQNNKQIILKHNKKWIKQHPNYEKERSQKRRTKNKALYRLNRRIIERKRRKNIRYKILSNYRNKLYKTIKRQSKSLSTMFLIGCEIDYLMYHLQCQFKKGMTWDNYGDWHIDHIKPCASFDLSKPSEQRKCFHYSNLQPLWAEENLKKNRF